MVSVPYIFVNNTQVADAIQVDADFQALVDAINAGNPGTLDTVNTIAAMRALPAPASPNAIQLLGYNTAGDKTAKTYYYSASSSAADNGGSVIQLTAVTGNGRYLLPDDNGSYDLVDFGGGLGASDDTPFFVACAATGLVVNVPEGTVHLNTLTAGVAISLMAVGQGVRGASPGLSIINTTQQSAIIFNLVAASTFVENVQFTYSGAGVSNGWCVAINGGAGKVPNTYVQNCIFTGIGGAISQGEHAGRGTAGQLYFTSCTGGLVSLVDGSAATDLAVLYGWGTSGNSGPWYVHDILAGLGTALTAGGTAALAKQPIFLLLDSQCNSGYFENININTYDTDLVIRQTLAGGGPNFNQFYQFSAQSPACTLLNGAIYIAAGADNDFYGMLFINGAGTAYPAGVKTTSYNANAFGIVIATGVTDMNLSGLEINGCNAAGIAVHGTGIKIGDGRVSNANNNNQNTGVAAANIGIYATANDVIVDGLKQMGGANTLYDVFVSTSAGPNILLGNNIYGATTFIMDASNIASIWPPEQGQSNPTPTITFATPGNFSSTYSVQFCQIWQVGSLVFFQIHITGNVTVGTASGQLLINTGIVGLNSQGGDPGSQSIALSRWNGLTLTASYTQVGAEFQGGSAQVGLVENGSAEVPANVTAAMMGGAYEFRLTGFYQQSKFV